MGGACSAYSIPMKVTRENLNIYFGSQTGTAEEFARVFAAEASSIGYKSNIIDLIHFDPQILRKQKIAIFIVATYGQGDATDNALNFLEWMRDKEGKVDSCYLKDVSFCVFGLGNKKYMHYNQMGITTNETLELFGAKRMADLGKGDDGGDIEEDFNEWKEHIFQVLRKQLHPEESNNDSSLKPNLQLHTNSGAKIPLRTSSMSLDAFDMQNLNQFRWDVTYDCISCPIPSGQPPRAMLDQSLWSDSNIRFFQHSIVHIIQNKELRPDITSMVSTRRIVLDISKSNLCYNTADNLAILPENSSQHVQAFATYLKYDLDAYVDIVLRTCSNSSSSSSPLPSNTPPPSLSPHNNDISTFSGTTKYPFPSPCTIRTILTCYLDILSVPRRSSLQRLIYYLRDDDHHTSSRDWIVSVTSKSCNFNESIILPRRTYLDIFSSELLGIAVPLAEILHIIPFIQPRYYTISSSSLAYPKEIHLTMGLEKVITPPDDTSSSGVQYKGICSNMLGTSLHRDIKVFVKSSSFRPPMSLHTPVIMICTGTGIAPMIALLQERKLLMDRMLENGVNQTVQTVHTCHANYADFTQFRNILYFGCRSPSVDYIYRDELMEWKSQGVLTDLHLAFSRVNASETMNSVEEELKQSECDDASTVTSNMHVQDLMNDPSNAKVLADLLVNEDKEKAAMIYVCGNVSMGKEVMSAFVDLLMKQKGLNADAAHYILKRMEINHHYVEEVW